MKIIGLTGFAKSGKSTAAQVLREMGGQEVAFAKHLKDVCAVVFGVERSHFDDQNFKEIEFYMPTLVQGYHIAQILNYFEVPARLQPEAILRHSGKYLRSPRHIAQYVGTEILRDVDTNIHINMAFKLNEGAAAPFLICSDVRFDNELISVQRGEGIVIGISRAAATPKDLTTLHPSESEIPELVQRADYLLVNDSTIDDLREIVRGLAEGYLR